MSLQRLHPPSNVLTKITSTLQSFSNLGSILHSPRKFDILSIVHHIILQHCEVQQNIAKFCEDYKASKVNQG